MKLESILWYSVLCGGAYSAAVGSDTAGHSVRIDAIVPTSAGQIGINPPAVTALFVFSFLYFDGLEACSNGFG